jgi:hypothetical protein
MPLLGLSLLLIVAALAASSGSCTRPNPDFCCTGAAECAALGVDEPRSCGSGRVCDSNVCLKTECSTAAECSDPDAPYCANQVCKSACAGDGDCLGAAGGPLCADDGVCVGCETNKDCTDLAAPICSPTRRTCEGCRADADCASGVCLAADGVCADPTDLIYVSEAGSDGNTCTRTGPCRTFSAAFSLLNGTRRVVRLAGDIYNIASPIIVDSKNVYIDADNTEIRRPDNGPLITISGTGKVTIEGIKFNLILNQDGIVIQTTHPVRVSQINATGPREHYAVSAFAGTVSISDSKLVNAGTLCGTTTLSIQSSAIQGSVIDSGDACIASLSGNRLTDVAVRTPGVLRATNNVVISTSPSCTNEFGASVRSLHFNTFVCRHNPPISDARLGYAISCGATDLVSNNLFAWDSFAPAPNCVLRHNLFPSFANPVVGEGNVYADVSTLFADYAAGDFHLSATSAARGAGEARPDVVVDLDGNPRPAPVGTSPDIGAYEAR